jgi:hypothetical protein
MSMKLAARSSGQQEHQETKGVIDVLSAGQSSTTHHQGSLSTKDASMFKAQQLGAIKL